MLQSLREEVECIQDYQLRIARINALRADLDLLAKEAENIKVLDLPLWYCEIGRHYDGGCWTDRGGYLLLREDLDQESFNWAKQHCKNDLDRDFSRELDPNCGCVLRHTGPYRMISIGNVATPPKRYYMGYLRDYSGADVRSLIRELKQRFGSNTWAERPADINGKVYYF